MSSLKRAGGGAIRASGGGGGLRRPQRSVLTASDFTYLGRLLVPVDASPNTNHTLGGGVRMGAGYGPAISGRRVGGVPHLFIAQSQARDGVNGLGALIELVVDQAPVLDSTAAIRLSKYQTWGDIYGSDVYASRVGTKDTNGSLIFGMHWDGEKLIWSFGPSYGSEHSRTKGATTFTGTTAFTSYGAWRTQCHAKQSNGYMMGIPAAHQAAFGGKNVMVGGVFTSINSLNSWGMSLEAFDASNLLSTGPSSYLTETDIAIPTQTVLAANISNKQARAATAQLCEKGLNNDGLCASASAVFAAEPVWTDIDSGLGAAWIRNTTKHGVVVAAQLVDAIANAAFRTAHYAGGSTAHYWYTIANGNCCHGHTMNIPGTGSHTSSLVPQLWIYNPQTLLDAAAGTITPYQAANTPASSHIHLNPMTLTSDRTIPEHRDPFGTGCWYDDVARRLYVLCNGIETWPTEHLPGVFVFEVAD